MSHFTEEQLQELATIFGLERAGDVLPVRGGVVNRNTKVWWRSENGPELVLAGSASHWTNIKNFPSAYQLTKPHYQIEYLEEGL